MILSWALTGYKPSTLGLTSIILGYSTLQYWHVNAPCNWLNQAHKVGTVKVLHDATAIAASEDDKVQKQIFVLRTPYFWSSIDSNSSGYHSFKGEKSLNSSKNVAEKENNGQNERIGRNKRTAICILLTINQHHCTKLCNMNVIGRLGTE